MKQENNPVKNKKNILSKVTKVKKKNQIPNQILEHFSQKDFQANQ